MWAIRSSPSRPAPNTTRAGSSGKPTPPMIHLESVQRRAFPKGKSFPFNLPVLLSLQELRFEAPVTLLVGENGSGKSTLLEGLACAADMVVVGSESTRTDKSLAHARELAKCFRLGWKKRTHRGFFLRAGDC